MSHATTLTANTANPLSLFTLPDPVEIILQGIIVEKGRLFLYITDGRHNYTIESKAGVLTSFLLFQQYLMDNLNVLVSHRSQNAPSRRRREYEWQNTLETAYERGRGK